MEDAWSVTGYAMPAEFQKIGLAGERSNWKVDTRVESTTSESRDKSVRHAQHTGTLGSAKPTHFQLRELEAAVCRTRM